MQKIVINNHLKLEMCYSSTGASLPNYFPIIFLGSERVDGTTNGTTTDKGTTTEQFSFFWALPIGCRLICSALVPLFTSIDSKHGDWTPCSCQCT